MYAQDTRAVLACKVTLAWNIPMQSHQCMYVARSFTQADEIRMR